MNGIPNSYPPPEDFGLDIDKHHDSDSANAHWLPSHLLAIKDIAPFPMNHAITALATAWEMSQRNSTLKKQLKELTSRVQRLEEELRLGLEDGGGVLPAPSISGHQNAAIPGLWNRRHTLRSLLQREPRRVEGAEVLNEIGRGGFADVYRGSWGGKTVALKKLLRFSAKPEKCDIFQAAFTREVLIWEQLSHPNILPFLGLDQESFAPRLTMVSPWMSNGNALEAMRSLKEKMRKETLYRWIAEAANGMKYLHSRAVVHGDIRAANILVDRELNVRITDFGLAAFHDPDPALRSGSSTTGSVRWIAPEILGGSLPRPNYGCDVYAFASLCIEMFTGTAPYKGIVRDAEVVPFVLGGGRPSRPPPDDTYCDLSELLWALMQRCWEDKPSYRPTMADVVVILAIRDPQAFLRDKAPKGTAEAIHPDVEDCD